MEKKEQLIQELLDGQVLFLDKPYSWTSFDVVNKLRNLFRQHLGIRKIKIGHAGTLDPLATGLLIICTGKKTKSIDHFQDLEKEYTGTFLLGETTPSFDMETQTDHHWPVSHITPELVEEATRLLSGAQQQLPPQFSAKKIEGERAYTFARKGEHVELKHRSIFIRRFQITRLEMPEADFLISCSKGTYIRAIARDFGIALHSGAFLKALRRTRIGPYSVDDARSPDSFFRSLESLTD
jgi:tRNA pseudouridine55 synthase